MTADTRLMEERLAQAGLALEDWQTEEQKDWCALRGSDPGRPSGVGLRGEVRPGVKETILWLDSLDKPVLAVDIASESTRIPER